jgi:hypothetical protein
MGGHITGEPAAGLLELALAADPVPAAGLVPGDGDVDEALEEVALGRLGRPPLVLEHLVRVVVPPVPDELEPSREPALRREP